MTHKISFSNGFTFILFFLISYSLQSCLTPRDRSIKEWEKYEWKTIVQEDESTSRNWIIYARGIRNSKFKEFKIVGNINVSPDNAIRVFKENDNKVIGKDGSLDASFATYSEKETGCQKITWQEEPANSQSTNNKNKIKPMLRASWEFAPIGSDKSKATYIVYKEPEGKILASKFNNLVKSELAMKFQQIEALALSIR